MQFPRSTTKFPTKKLPQISSNKKNKSTQKQFIQTLLHDLNNLSPNNTRELFSSQRSNSSFKGTLNGYHIPQNFFADDKHSPKSKSPISKRVSINIRSKIHFQLVTKKLISIEFEPKTSITPSLKKIIESKSGQYDSLWSLWLIPFDAYDSILEAFQECDEKFIIKTISQLAFQIHKHSEYKSISIATASQPIEISYEDEGDEGKSIDDLPKKLLKGLYEFQKEGIEFGIKKNCRLLLADEMGIGKTIQAISLCYLYQESWPVLIICPSSVKYLWKNELIRWLSIDESDIQIINSSKTKIKKEADFYILSYDLVRRIDYRLNRKKFQFVILDESHCIKNKDSLRSFYITPIAQRAKRVLLLSGTPLLAKPVEGYSMLHILRPDLFHNFREYGNRYCDPQPTAFGISWSGASNTKELHFILNTLMIRRLKKDVLNQLPPKRRMKLEIDCDKCAVKTIKDFFKANTLRLTMPDIYLLSGKAKIKGIKMYIKDLFEANVKFMVFAHHKTVLNAIEELAIQSEVYYIRIDGSVKNQDRFDLVNEYQTNKDCKLAILSINAAATGITLTEGSMVVFAELTWTPAIMIQAEDRAHRIGQKHDHLDIVYLYGKRTIDDFIFKKLEQKLKIVSTTLDDIQSEWAFRQKEKEKRRKREEENSQSDEDESDESNDSIDDSLDDDELSQKIIKLCEQAETISNQDTASVSKYTDLGRTTNNKIARKVNSKSRENSKEKLLESNLKNKVIPWDL